MDVIEAIKKRRSVRNYKPDAIPEEVLERLLNAMRQAPSGANRQPYKFIVVRDEQIKAKLAEACHFKPGRQNGHPFIAEAPVAIVACGSENKAAVVYYKGGEVFLADGQAVAEMMKEDPVKYESCLRLDVAIAMEHLALAAVEEGLGTCWLAGFDEGQVKELLSVPDDMRIVAVMPVGYPVSWPEAKPRKPLEEIVRYDRYR